MKKFLVGGLAVVGALAILAVIVAVGFSLISQLGKGRVPGKTILEVDFEQGLIEYVSDDPIDSLLHEDVPTVRDVVEALERASSDGRVVALVARIGAVPMGLARVQEVRDAVQAFRESEKIAVAYADTFGEFGPGNVAYYLATAFDEIYLQPSGDIGLTGFIYENPFIKGTLDKLGVTPRMDQRHEYKNAMNLFTERKFTEAHREALQGVMKSRFDQMVRGVAESRNMSEEQVRSLIDEGPYLGQEALEANLVDGLAYRDEVYEKVKQAAGESAKLLYLSKYLKRAGRPHTRGETIALIHGVGGIVRGKSGYDAMSGERFIGSDTVTAAFREAIEDDRVKAILFRVDSPGGSYVASDTIWRETARAKQAGKPVVVSMGGVAGSGGYFVAMAADKIVAQPATITGSIGVLAGKFLTSGMWEKVGLSWDEVHTSGNATMWTGTHDYSPEEYERFQTFLDRVYEDFTSKVAEGRGLQKERVLENARGRIWTGEDAKELGLVDELGGFSVALRLAKEAAGIDADAKVRLKPIPRKKSPWQKLFGEGPESSEGRAVASLVRSIRTIQPMVRLVRRMGILSDPGVLSMPDAELVE